MMKSIITRYILSAFVFTCFSLTVVAQSPFDDEQAGAVSVVDGEELEQTFNNNVANSLYGRIAGLTVIQGSSEPGNNAPTLRARGTSTFGSGRDVLIVIDGLPSSYELFQQLTASEIEKIELLKDAASTAVWGNRGANGVLSVTTRRGSIMPLKMNIQAQYGLQQPTRMPDFLDAADYASLYNEARVNDYGPGTELYSAADISAYRSGADPYQHPNVDWYDKVLRDLTPMSNYNLTAQGGSSTVKYFVLLNLAKNSGIIEKGEKVSDNTKNFSYTRYNFRTNVDVQLSKHISSVFTLGGTVEDRTNPGRARNNVSGEYSTNLFSLLAKLPPLSFPVYNEDGYYGGNSAYYNPWGEITQTGYYKTNRRTAQLSAKFIGDLEKITPGLKIDGTISFNSIYKGYTIGSAEYARYDMQGNALSEDVELSINESTYSQWRNFLVYGGVSYDRHFNKNHVKANILTGYEYISQSASEQPYKDIHNAAAFTYSFDGKYTIDLAASYDGTDRFARGNRFGFFPVVGVAWVISRENFLKNVSAINYLKLRTSYGLTGNKETGAPRYPFNQYYTTANYYLGTSNTSNTGYLPSTIAFENATWEKDRQFNVGLDAKLLNVLTLQFDCFHKKRYDILATPYVVVPNFVGFSIPAMNIGETTNQGFEIIARYDDSKGDDCSWFVEAMASYARNKIDFNAEAPTSYPYQQRTGQRIDQPFVLGSMGLFNSESEIANAPVQTFANVQPGDIRYIDMNGDNMIDEDDFAPMGYTRIPELTVGIETGFKWKGFDTRLQMQGAFNRTVYLSGALFEAFQNDGQISEIALGRWTPSTVSSATYPRLSSINNMNNYQSSSFWQRNGNFLKLRTFEVGYTLPHEFTSRLNIESVRVYLNGNNLFSIDHLDGHCDPEVLSGYPSMRTFSIGLNVEL
ncbi:MAG: SusC/RagA family TonB-linked outer membrane protein [Prevotella sp.]|nr:SusC/RagA family TonB-linked outer membrane protein [Prevotella sp.]